LDELLKESHLAESSLTSTFREKKRILVDIIYMAPNLWLAGLISDLIPDTMEGELLHQALEGTLKLWCLNHEKEGLIDRTSTGIYFQELDVNAHTLACSVNNGVMQFSRLTLDDISVDFDLVQMFTKPLQVKIKRIRAIGAATPSILTPNEMAEIQAKLWPSGPLAHPATYEERVKRYGEKQKLKDGAIVAISSFRFVTLPAANDTTKKDPAGKYRPPVSYEKPFHYGEMKNAEYLFRCLCCICGYRSKWDDQSKAKLIAQVTRPHPWLVGR
jgi:hypothetical protein